MEYNSTRGKMIISEYGRNIQKMVEFIVELEDREKRSRMARVLINIMAQMHPEMRDAGDLKRKLWDHLHIMADFKLDVDSPYPAPSPQALAAKPQRIPYTQEDILYKPYGKNIARIIEKAVEYEEGPEKEAFTKTIANHLKKAYLNWNRDSVNDELITKHLAVLSHGKLKLSEDFRLNNTTDILARNKKKKFEGKPKNNQPGSNSTNRPRRPFPGKSN
jgi:Domain of unknown function (DUF4290)